jgi:mRNA-degrading endonuclease YafQ of YafQ-DinJ toxin-antitoxin module
MRKVIWEEGFRRAVRRRTRKQPQLQAKIIQTLIDLASDSFMPSLKTHKLQGELKGL